MAVDNNDNEIDGNGVTSDNDGCIVNNIYSIIFTAEGCYRRESERREGHGPAQCRRTFEGAWRILLRCAVVATPC